MSAPRSVRFHRFLECLFRLALLAYPPALRRAWSAEMTETFLLRIQDGTERLSASEFLWFVLREIWAVLGTGLRLRWKDGRGAARPPRGRSREILSKRGTGMTDAIRTELALALRGLRRTPGYTLVATLVLALGIGANTAMFSVVQGVVLKALPYPEPDGIVVLRENKPSRGWGSFRVSPLNFWDWQERNRSLELVAAYQEAAVAFSGGDRPESVLAYRVTEDFLEILGGEPVLGRGVLPQDLEPDAESVVLLTHGFWENAFGGDPGILGRAVTLDGAVHTVAGILPDGWEGFSEGRVEVVLPLKTQPYWLTSRGSHFLIGLGRLRPGVTLAQAQADLSSVAAALEREYPETNQGWGAEVRLLKEEILGSTGPQLLTFMAGIGLVLLIACANLANMTLARSLGRTRELAVRKALGAGRGRLAGHLLAESLLLSVLGGVAGSVLAALVVKSFVAAWPELLPRTREIGVNGTVAFFALGVSLASTVLSGLLPALNVAGGADLQETLRKGGRGLTGDRSRRWMRRGLVMTEVTLAVVLLVGAGLLLRSFQALQREDPGFKRDSRLIVVTSLAPGVYSTSGEITRFAETALDGIRSLPGVRAAALSSLIPLEGSDNIWGFWIRGRPLDPGQSDGSAHFYRVSSGYLEAMGIPLVSGRGIEESDRGDTGPVVVISSSLANQQFPDGDALGQRLIFDPDEPDSTAEIVGVAGDVQHGGLGEESLPQMYVPFSQFPTRSVDFLVEGSILPSSLVEGVRRAIAAVDPNQPVAKIFTADDMVAGVLSLPRFRTLLMTGLGLVGLVLAVVGIYGVLAYAASQRSKEVSIRMALGATPTSVLGLMLREGGPTVGLGLLAGLGCAAALSRILESMLFGVSSQDPAVFLSVPLLLGLVALAAMLIPAGRAARTDPVRALAEE